MMKKNFIKRVINFIRPKPRYIKMPLDDILRNSHAKDIVEKFNDFYYTSGNPGNLMWHGVEMIKNPCDLWIYIEILQELKPSVIIETGTHEGASARFYSDISAALGFKCKIITVDINPKWSFKPELFNISSIVGLSTDKNIIERIGNETRKILSEQPGNVIVMLDSDHSKENVLNEMEAYGPLVNNGSYMIVEDTNINGHPSFISHGPGPWEAVEEFFKKKQDIKFEIDRSKERFMLTFNPKGFLKRVK